METGRKRQDEKEGMNKTKRGNPGNININLASGLINYKRINK